MDLGLNNRNTLGSFHPLFEDVVFFVEATRHEQFGLWKDFSKERKMKPLSDELIAVLPDYCVNFDVKKQITKLNNELKQQDSVRVDWVQVSSGFSLTIGHVGKLPIVLCFNFAIVNGKKICFYDCTSRVCDHTKIEDWITSGFQLTHDNYHRHNLVDAASFSDCIKALKILDKEPRNTVYKKR